MVLILRDDTEENDNFEATNLRSTNGGQSNQVFIPLLIIYT